MLKCLWHRAVKAVVVAGGPGGCAGKQMMVKRTSTPHLPVVAMEKVIPRKLVNMVDPIVLTSKISNLSISFYSGKIYIIYTFLIHLQIHQVPHYRLIM